MRCFWVFEKMVKESWFWMCNWWFEMVKMFIISVIIMGNVLDWLGVVIDLSGLKVIIWQKSCFKTENLMLPVRPKWFWSDFSVCGLTKIMLRLEKIRLRFCHTRNLKNVFFFTPNASKVVLKGMDFILTINERSIKKNEVM